MSVNNYKYYTLQVMNKIKDKITLGESYYAKNIDAIKKELKHKTHERSPVYAMLYKTIIHNFDSITINNLKKKIENNNLEGIASDIQTYMKMYTKENDEYVIEGNRLKITQLPMIWYTKQERYNPILVKFQKDDKKFIFSPKIEDDQQYDINNDEKNIELQKKYRTNVEYMEQQIAEGNKQFGIYLLEEKIKDTFKGLGSEIQKVKNESLEKQITQIKMKQLQRGISILESKIIEELKNSNSNNTIETQNVFQQMGNTLIKIDNPFLLGF